MSPGLRHSSIAGRVRSIALPSKPHLEIHIGDDQKPQTYIHAFSTTDKIQGHISVFCSHDTPFDDVEILLLGCTKTYVERITPASVNGRSEAFQQFLRLSQPMTRESLPEPHVLKAGQTHRIPFTFVVPQRLLDSSCKHSTANDKLKQAHLTLPPSLGDHDTSGYRSTPRDDVSPSMVRVWYGIRARIVKKRPSDQRPISLAEEFRKLRIVPSMDEQPPVTIDDKDDEYCLRKEKSIKKTFFGSKSGRIVMEGPQPKSLRLPPATANPEDMPTPTTMATILLRFDPAQADAPPPRLSELQSKLKLGTFYSTKPYENFPSKRGVLYDAHGGVFVDAVDLGTRNVTVAQWDRHEPGQGPPPIPNVTKFQITATAPDFCPAPTKTYNAKFPFYTAKLLVPITAPRQKMLVPTFYSCLTSRIYILELNLTGLSPGVDKNAHLKIPLQVTSDTEATGANISRAGSLQALSSPEDDYLEQYDGSSPTDASRRRSMNATDLLAEPDSQTQAPPPEYSYFASRTGGLTRADHPSWAASPAYSMVR